jgi:GntR family transcriptional regulator
LRDIIQTGGKTVRQAQLSKIAADPDEQGPDGPRFAPLYRQVKALITERLQRGDWKPGEPIPSETELARRYQVSQGTVRKAIDEMATERLVVRRQGRGTFVSSHLEAGAQFRFLRLRLDAPAIQDTTLSADEMRHLEYARPSGEGSGGGPGTRSVQGERLRSRVIDCRRIKAPAEVARLLHLRAGEPVVFIRRVLELSGDPTVLDEIWLPGARFRGLSADQLSTYDGPLYGLFESEFGTRMIRAEERLKAVAATPDVARELSIGAREPVLRIDRLTRTYQDVPVELRRAYCTTSRHHYFNELS